VLGLAKILLIMFVLGSLNPFEFLGQPTPGWYSWLIENKMYACLMIFFLANAVETQLISTGAFEITLDGMPVWSKLESGRIPQPPEVFQIIENHFNMRNGIPDAGGGGGPGEIGGGFKDEL